ncbi:cell wall-active antibiotics response protein LiaF [Paenibacillus turpanensis]|uniref:cell wall-active antibiotics response protein LiaF n=1 Tax=Paenibacillus turpanensis TaxID=2689078 RepID=UPI0014080265|nr:cell wall-active antibiotics response protein LiaF [Paenibacillus turpanensis]
MKAEFVNRLIMSFLIIGAGVVLLLQQIGWIQWDWEFLITHFWPVLIIALGIRGLFTPRRRGRTSGLGSFLLIVLGAYFLWNELTDLEIGLDSFIQFAMPALLILTGVMLLLRSARKKRTHPSAVEEERDPIEQVNTEQSMKPAAEDRTASGEASKEQSVPLQGEKQGPANEMRPRDNVKQPNHSSLFGEITVGPGAVPLKPMNVSHWMGNVTLKLDDAVISDGETKLTVSLMFGDIRIILPQDHSVEVRLQGNSLAGDFRMNDRFSGGLLRSIDWQPDGFEKAERKMTIQTNVLFGSVTLLRLPNTHKTGTEGSS